MNQTITEALYRIEVREKTKPVRRVTPIYRLDGYQHGLPGFSGCHNYTVLRKGPAKGASFCIDGIESDEPDESTILERVREKERAFGEGRAG